MTHDDVLAKMDALMYKHHDAFERVSVMEDIPVLTEALEEADESIPLLTEVVEIEPPPLVAVQAAPQPEANPPSDTLLAQLDSRIRAAIEQRLPYHIVEAVDKALPVVIEEFALQLESLVRAAVAEELRQQQAELLRQNKL